MISFTYSKTFQSLPSLNDLKRFLYTVLNQNIDNQTVVVYIGGGWVTGWVAKKSILLKALDGNVYVLNEDNFFKDLEIELPMHGDPGSTYTIGGFRIKLSAYRTTKAFSIDVTFNFCQTLFDCRYLRESVKRLTDDGFTTPTPNLFENFIKESLALEEKVNQGTRT